MPFSNVHGASEFATWREKATRASCSAVRDGRDARESAVDRPILKGRALHRAAEILVAATRERLEKGSVPEVLPSLFSDPFTEA